MGLGLIESYKRYSRLHMWIVQFVSSVFMVICSFQIDQNLVSIYGW